MASETSHTPSSTFPPSFLETFTVTVTPGLVSSPSAIPTTSTEKDDSKIQSSVDTTMTTTLIVLGVVLPVLVIFSTAFWCWHVKRRRKSGMVIGRRSEWYSAPISPHEKSTFNVVHSPSSQNVEIAKWAARSNSQRSSTTYWSDGSDSSLSTEYRPPSPDTPLPQSVQKAKRITRSNSQSSMTTYRSDFTDSSSSTEYRPPSPSMVSIAESASMYSQPSHRSSKPGSLRSHRTGRTHSLGNPFGTKFPSLSGSNYSTERHIYADSSLAVPTRPTRLSIVHEDDIGP
ncbi:hypothetical protein E1B28_000373 [Marasmius oreades]|uniref:Uncharacterized protein n=1 Tax=Marasmius oreades TaxID=181124 RepID=A0A9P7V1D1_9AGAR|nr:uncharacterized protein E1B28_000373 [Marasmius oreades]KAG7098420.1 hypothetical protein E1B28_000373 [Marasmius oreades]